MNLETILNRFDQQEKKPLAWERYAPPAKIVDEYLQRELVTVKKLQNSYTYTGVKK